MPCFMHDPVSILEGVLVVAGMASACIGAFLLGRFKREA